MLYTTGRRNKRCKILSDMKRLTILITGMILLLSAASCKKNKSTDLGPNVNCSNDVILSVSSFTTIFNLLIKARLDPELANTGMTVIDKVAITYDPVGMEYTFLFMGDVSPDSVRRSGQIKMMASGDVLEKGAVATVQVHNYYEDNGLVGGTDSILNLGLNDAGKTEFAVRVSGAVINKAIEGGTIRVKLDLSFAIPPSSLVSGQDILFFEKGTLSGVSSKGYSFSASLRDSMQDDFACPWIRSGIIDLHVPDAEITDGYIDFVSADGCSDIIWYYFGESSFKIKKNQYYLKN
jgi:hypothetical protein